MKSAKIACFILFFLLSLNYQSNGQVDDFCSEAGLMPSLDSPFVHVPYVYGRIFIKGVEPGAKMPNVVVKMLDARQFVSRITIGKSGNYCFKSGNGGVTLIVEVNGIEAARRTLPNLGPSQQREDFEIQTVENKNSVAPGVVSAKFYYPPNPTTTELYKRLSEAEGKKDQKKSIEVLKQIVAADDKDFVAWAKIGVLYFEAKDLEKAFEAFKKSLELRVDYTPVWINVGKIRVEQKQFEAAIEIFKHAIALDPKSARAFQLLGEAYLQTKQGTLGSEALNKAIELDPLGMAECHLQLAHLYQLAKANKLATREYKLFLAKVPNHPDRKKFEQYIKDNPEEK